VRLAAGSLAATILGTDRTVERYLCSYGLDRQYADRLREHGLRFSGVDADGDVRVAELPGHPFFLATLFQPELAGDEARPHPIIAAFATAVCAYAGRSNESSLARPRA
jgi:CTP synthase (UTP-ammonia lyase)